MQIIIIATYSGVQLSDIGHNKSFMLRKYKSKFFSFYFGGFYSNRSRTQPTYTWRIYRHTLRRTMWTSCLLSLARSYPLGFCATPTDKAKESDSQEWNPEKNASKSFKWESFWQKILLLIVSSKILRHSFSNINICSMWSRINNTKCLQPINPVSDVRDDL